MYSFQKKIELSPRLKLSVGRKVGPNQKFKIAAYLLLLAGVGLTFNAARLIFTNQEQNTVVQTGSPQVLGASDTKTLEEVKFVEYKVEKGDTLFSISQKFGAGWTTLATLNNLKSPFTVKPGQIIKIPVY